MKTTIELPDPLFRRAKVLAAQRGTTLRELVMEGLRRVSDHPDGPPAASPALSAGEEQVATMGAHGLPVLRRRTQAKRPVTRALVNRIRDELSI